MRLGGPLFADCSDPQTWVKVVQACGYRAAYCPVGADTDDALVERYSRAAAEHDIVIAEVGAWSNPINPDTKQRVEAIEHCRRQLDLADRIGAKCCVNIAGSRGEIWDGPYPDNLTSDTFDLIVETVRGIIDAVKPRRTFYALETMPWIYPDSPESYVKLIEAIDRPTFAVHLDPANLVNSPERFFKNGDLIRRCFELLGPRIKSCHAKDIAISPRMTVHLDEVRPASEGSTIIVILPSSTDSHPMSR